MAFPVLFRSSQAVDFLATGKSQEITGYVRIIPSRHRRRAGNRSRMSLIVSGSISAARCMPPEIECLFRRSAMSCLCAVRRSDPCDPTGLEGLGISALFRARAEASRGGITPAMISSYSLRSRSGSSVPSIFAPRSSSFGRMR